MPANLGLGQRQQVDDLHAAGQAFGDPGYGEEIGRAGEQIAPRLAVQIHSSLDGPQEFGRALHFVDGEPAGSAHQSGWIAARRLENRLVVEREELAAARHQIADQGGLAALAGPIHQDHRRVPERRGHGGGGKARMKCGFFFDHFGFRVRPIRIDDASDPDCEIV